MAEQLLVKLIGHVVAEAAELLVEGGDGNHAGGVAPWADRDLDVRHILAEEFVGFRFEAEAIHLVEVGGGLEGDNEIKALVRADRGEAVEVGDVDDTDPADLHVAAREVGRGGDQLAADVFHPHHVIRHQRAAALQQADRGFRFPGAALTDDEHPDPAHIDHAAVDGHCRSELVLEADRRGVEEFHGDLRGAENGDRVLLGDGH